MELAVLVGLVFIAGVAKLSARKRRRRSKIGTVGHLLHGPYRASEARLFVTVDGKTTELRRVRQLTAKTTKQIKGVVRGMRRSGHGVRRPRPHGWVTGFVGDGEES